MSKPHTPGPWKVETYHGSLFKITKPDFKVGDEVTHRLEADRRLIEAAPEMLEALETYIRLFDEIKSTQDHDEKRHVIDAQLNNHKIVRELIKKVRGVS